MHRGRNHCARHAQALGDVALHLRAKHQFDIQGGDLRFDLEVVVGDQWLDAVKRGGLAHFARLLAAVGAQADHGEAEFARRHARGGHGVGGVTKDEDALAGQVG